MNLLIYKAKGTSKTLKDLEIRRLLDYLVLPNLIINILKRETERQENQSVRDRDLKMLFYWL